MRRCCAAAGCGWRRCMGACPPEARIGWCQWTTGQPGSSTSRHKQAGFRPEETPLAVSGCHTKPRKVEHQRTMTTECGLSAGKHTFLSQQTERTKLPADPSGIGSIRPKAWKPPGDTHMHLKVEIAPTASTMPADVEALGQAIQYVGQTVCPAGRTFASYF
jgi:hypothetical protein